MVRPMKFNKSGFTVVELLISISVFSVAMMAVMSAVIVMGRQYQKASYTTQLSSASKSLHQAIANDINYGSTVPEAKFTAGSPKYGYICLTGNLVYAWEASAGGSIKYGLYKYQYTNSCSGNPDAAVAAAVTNGTNILPKNGFVAKIDIDSSVGADLSVVKTDFRTGEADMFSNSGDVVNSDTTCLPVLKGGDFCAVVQYNSSVKKRI